MSGRAQLIKASRQIKRRRKIIQLFGIICLIIIILALIVYALYRPKLRIQNIEIVGADSVNKQEIIQLVRQETAGSYFWLVPKNSRFFYSVKNLTEKISLAFPRIGEIKLAIADRKLLITIVERESKLLWCLGNSASEGCYFVDSTGVAFSLAPNFADHVLFEVYQEVSTSSSASDVLGRVVLPPEMLNGIFSQKDSVSRVLNEKKIFDRSIITSVKLVADDSYIFNIESPAGSGYKWHLITNSKMSGESLSELLTALWESEMFNSEVIKTKKQLSYVNASLASKVFFKVENNNASTQ